MSSLSYMALSASVTSRHGSNFFSSSSQGDHACLACDDELKKFEPCLDVTDAESAIYDRELTDILDILQEMLREAKSGRRMK